MALGDPHSPPPTPGLPSDNISQKELKTCSPHHPALLCWVPCTASLTVSSMVAGGGMVVVLHLFTLKRV